MENIEKIIEEIVALEWEDFQSVHGADGRAPCQDNKKAFEINRKSQFLAWSPLAAESYLSDLKRAKAAGRNLLTEKYARMMAWTHPKEYKQIEQHLPGVGREAMALVNKIVAMQLAWQREFVAAYPRLAARGRKLEKREDSLSGEASFEAYLRGELATYSVPTLSLYANHLDYLKQKGENISQLSTGHMVRLSGYASLEEAEAQT